MEGNIVAVYETKYGTCLVSDAAYANASEQELKRRWDNMQKVALSIFWENARKEKEEKTAL